MLQTLKSTQAMADAMRGATQVRDRVRQHQPCELTASAAAVHQQVADCVWRSEQRRCQPAAADAFVAASCACPCTPTVAQLQTHAAVPDAVCAASSAAAAVQAMRVMNKRMNLPNMQKILMEFEKKNERMEMTSDMMGDAIDDAMEVRAQATEDARAAASEGSRVCVSKALQRCPLHCVVCPLWLWWGMRRVRVRRKTRTSW
jgi:hypothetical protein